MIKENIIFIGKYINPIEYWTVKNCMNTSQNCIILTFDRAVNQETGASARWCQRRHLGLWTGWIRCTSDAYGKQVDVKQLYNKVPQTAWVSWNQLVEVSCSWSSSCSSRQREPAPDRGLAAPSDPWLSSPAEWERSAAIVRGSWGQYVAVCSVSNSSLTHNPFATLSQPFRE